MSAQTLSSTSWPVGRWTATLSVTAAEDNGPRAVLIEWSPCVPDRLTSAEVSQYRRGRDAALKRLGVNALVIET